MALAPRGLGDKEAKLSSSTTKRKTTQGSGEIKGRGRGGNPSWWHHNNTGLNLVWHTAHAEGAERGRWGCPAPDVREQRFLKFIPVQRSALRA